MSSKKKIWYCLILALAIALLGLIPAVSAGQETCPHDGEWVKVDGLSGTSYTFSVPAGYTLVEWCYKASTTVNSGSANVVGPGTYTVTSTVTNQNGNVQDLSHASFRLVETPPPPPPPCEQTNTCPPPPECDATGATETTDDDCPPPPPPPECDATGQTETTEDDCPPPPECDATGLTETTEDDCPPPPPPPECDEVGETETTEDDCPPPPPPPVCESNCNEVPPPPPPPPNGCEISPLLREDVGNYLVLTSPDGAAQYYSILIEDRPQLGYAIANINTWVHDGIYGLYYGDGRHIGTMTITRDGYGNLTCVWTVEVPQDPEPPITTIVCVGCGPREEEWYLIPDSDSDVVGRAIDVNGDQTSYYVEDDVTFDGAESRETPLGTVYYGYLNTSPEGVTVFSPCSVTVTLSQATVNADGTWTFVRLAEQWPYEWQLAAERYGFGQDFVDLALATPVGGTFTVSAP